MIELLLVLVSVALVVACGAFVAAEFSFVTVDRSRVDREADEGDRRARGVRQGLRTLSTQLSAAQVGITVTNLLIGYLAQPSVASLIDAPLESLGVSAGAVDGVALTVAFILANAVTMIFGELVPKNLAIANAMGTAKAVQGFQRGFTRIIHPLVRVTNGIANWILRRVGIEPQEELASARSPEELTSLVRRSAEKGTLEEPTAELLEKSLEFGELRADDVMTPRVKVKTLAPDQPVIAVIEAARAGGFSRFPVISEGSEIVEGIVHVKHAVAVPHEDRDDVPIRDVMADPVLVPSTIELDPLLAELRKVGLQVAIVVDEFGSFDGIVTLEDLIEEIVGEVRDEHDRDEDPVREIAQGIWAVSGLMRPDEVEDQIGVRLPEDEDYETVAGLIGFELGRVPGRGDSVRVEATNEEKEPLLADLYVLRMDGLRVDRVRLVVSKPQPEEDGEGEK
ncbi:MAG TPA: hemolysin family protein [Solirubrobacterales bacterium]|jgi:CBS domain containing-hemolysin-like protein|nr:hemolysin family protein [Solirubrobacterales bacterium]HMU26857.1 hemolysin family protein [Solirubrobacterales bacterium]HMX70529.1 hemolysin family protein [Solirubrobacterales bacterium]HMY25149.1 hemolysin family protein [Solirubrobacterales bacterium]HNA23187.1 hemolysin family protein [Solirubrobacterales bacterium]